MAPSRPPPSQSIADCTVQEHCNPACPSKDRQLLVRTLPLAVCPLLHHGVHSEGGNPPPPSWRPVGVPSVGSSSTGINPPSLCWVPPGPCSPFYLYPKHAFRENAALSEPSPSGVSGPLNSENSSARSLTTCFHSLSPAPREGERARLP